MTSTAAAPTRTARPDDAYCIGCGYALRDLPEHRCPECGREFDPTKPWTMDLLHRRARARLLEWLASPMSVGVRRAIMVSCGMILWGAAWLPGGFIIETSGWVVLILAASYGVVRRMVRRITRICQQQPPLPRPLSEYYTPARRCSCSSR